MGRKRSDRLFGGLAAIAALGCTPAPTLNYVDTLLGDAAPGGGTVALAYGDVISKTATTTAIATGRVSGEASRSGPLRIVLRARASAAQPPRHVRDIDVELRAQAGRPQVGQVYPIGAVSPAGWATLTYVENRDDGGENLRAEGGAVRITAVDGAKLAVVLEGIRFVQRWPGPPGGPGPFTLAGALTVDAVAGLAEAPTTPYTYGGSNPFPLPLTVGQRFRYAVRTEGAADAPAEATATVAAVTADAAELSIAGTEPPTLLLPRRFFEAEPAPGMGFVGAAEATVPAGTFACRYYRERLPDGDELELWQHPAAGVVRARLKTRFAGGTAIVRVAELIAGPARDD